jgi:hypothetical protein
LLVVDSDIELDLEFACFNAGRINKQTQPYFLVFAPYYFLGADGLDFLLLFCSCFATMFLASLILQIDNM